jgi:hypothetical protein
VSEEYIIKFFIIEVFSIPLLVGILIEINIIIVFFRVMTGCRLVEGYNPSVEYMNADPWRNKRNHETAKSLVRL